VGVVEYNVGGESVAGAELENWYAKFGNVWLRKSHSKAEEFGMLANIEISGTGSIVRV